MQLKSNVKLMKIKNRWPTRKMRLMATLACLTLAACGLGDGAIAMDESTAMAESTAMDAAGNSPASFAHAYITPSLPTARYEPPATHVVFVAPPRGGSTTPGDGSPAAPYATLREALAFVHQQMTTEPWTIVLHGGVYREGELDVMRDNVTIQRFGTEPVSLYGSAALTGFAGTGPYTKTLRSDDPITPIDPSYLEADCANLDWKHGSPDEGWRTAFAVTRAGVPLRRVATHVPLQTGQFSYDAATNLLTVKDSPSQIELATKLYALKIRGSNVKLAGLDIENYATCVVDWEKHVGDRSYYKAAVIFYKDQAGPSGGTLENSTVANNAASAVAIFKGSDVRLTGNVLVNNGWNGAHADGAAGLIVTDNRISFNNVRRLGTYADAGMKITNIQNGVVVGNVFEHNAATGFWCDQRCGVDPSGTRWFVIARNLARYNDATGIFYEISHRGVIASNVVHDNGASGIAAFGSRDLRIWNNTVVDNNALADVDNFHAGISVIDAIPCAAGDTVPGGMLCTKENGLEPIHPGHGDHCEPSSGGALANTCNAEGVSIVNNLLSGSRSARPLLNVEDDNSSLYGAKRIVSSQDFQAYWRSSVNAPQPLIEWQTHSGRRAVAYRSLADMKTDANMGADAEPGSIRYEVHGVELLGGAVHPFFVDYPRKNFVQNPGSPEVWGNGADLPLEVRRAVYWPETSPPQPSARIGAIEWAQKPAVATCPLAAPVYRRQHPTTGDHLLTASVAEANNAAALGYTFDHGIAFKAAIAPRNGLAPVFRVFNPTSKLHFWTTSASEQAVAVERFGYTVDEGIGFYASPAAGPCLTGVYRLQLAGNHVYSVSTAERDLLVAAGWDDEGIRFYVAPR